ncbi:MAG: hypothetical protein H6751_05165 [Candidatus Omnitrophica bacterium]|nr:hypothetical protein [Candidatus Omnitrophota bacterium]
MATRSFGSVPRTRRDLSPNSESRQVESNLRRVQAAWTFDSEQKVDELSLRLDFLQNPDFHWLPHLTPSEGFVVGQHVFRSPAIVTADSSVVVAIIPDLDLVGKDPDLLGSWIWTPRNRWVGLASRRPRFLFMSV